MSGILLLLLVPVGAGARELTISQVREIPLAVEYSDSHDVRWGSEEDSVLLAVTDTGVVDFNLKTGSHSHVLLPAGNKYGEDGVWLAARLGTSSEFLAVAGPFFDWPWKRISEDKLRRSDYYLELIEDLRHRWA